MIDWLDQRTGFKGLLACALFENIPGGARWRYVWGSTLVFTFFVQIVTGIFLWMAYSPSVQTAWESVFYIQYEMQGGWFLRGIHHYTAQAMNILLILHLLQIMIDGAYKAPREVNFWFGIGLLILVLALSLTGYLLPWDQKGYWAMQVTTNLIGITPFIGNDLQKLIIGGAEYGHHTLTRFFAFHAGILPFSVIILIIGHIYLFRRHGIKAKQPFRRRDAPFWPDQVLKDSIACLSIFAIVLIFVIKGKITGEAELGASLGAPAEPSEPFSAARPEWYFLFLFQFLKYFPGEKELYGALIIPSTVLIFICLMPFFGRWKIGHIFNMIFISGLLIGIAFLTFEAIREDRSNPDYLSAVKSADQAAKRIRVLAKSPEGIPAKGALSLLRNDPKTQGPKLFAAHCASCHRYDGHDGIGNIPSESPSAADLRGFASRLWLAQLLDPRHIASDRFFGKTAFADGKMVGFVNRKVARFDDDQKQQLQKALIALSAEARLPSQKVQDQTDLAIIEEGRQHLLDLGCADCHEFHFEDEDASAPDLTNYGSRDWLIGFISDPNDESHYGERNDRMPDFGTQDILSKREIELLTDWIRGDWFEKNETNEL